MHFTEEQLKRYAKPLSDTEKSMCKKAIDMVRESLQTLGFESEGDMDVLKQDTFSYRLKMRSHSISYKFNIFVKSPYAINTKLRKTRDVHIALVTEDEFYIVFRKVYNSENYTL